MKIYFNIDRNFYYCLFIWAFCLTLPQTLLGCSRQASIINDPGVTLPPQKELKEFSKKAIDFNNQAIELYFKSAHEGKLENQKVIDLLDQSLKIDPNYHPGLALKASILMVAKRYREANEAFEMALKIRPHAAEYYIGQYMALAKSGKLIQAKERCRYAIAAYNIRLRAKPNDPFIRTDRAIAVFFFGDKELAIQELKELLPDNPDSFLVKEILKQIENSDGKEPWNILD